MWRNVHPPYLNEPTTDDWRDFISSLRELTEDNFQIHFSGGEPLLKKEVIELIRYANSMGFSTLLTTNGYLIDRDTAMRINDAGLSSIVISLDSLNAEVHDFLRGKQGVHQRVMEAIEDLSNCGGNTTVCISTVMSEITLGGLLDLVHWVQQNDEVDGIGLQVITQILSDGYFPRAEWYKRKEYDFLWPKDTDKACNIIGELMQFKENIEKNGGGCKIGNSITQLRAYQAYFRNTLDSLRIKRKCPRETGVITIDPFGDVFLCSHMGTVGNIKKSSIKHILASAAANRLRERMVRCDADCMAVLNCNFEEENVL